MLAVTGWRAETQAPMESKGLFIAAPHTSGADLFFMLGVAWTLRIRLSWIGKSELFRWPMGPIYRAMGGIPVERGSRTDQVRSLADEFERVDAMYLAIAAPGTRKRQETWKSGFYYIAQEARVPLLCGFLDYKRKVGGIGPLIALSGDLRTDMDKIRAFYETITPRCISRKSGIRLKDEDSPANL